LLVTIVVQWHAASAGDTPAGTGKPLTITYTLTAVLSREPPALQFDAGPVRWSCVHAQCGGVAAERFNGCTMTRSCIELRRRVGQDNAILGFSAAGHPIEGSRLQLCNHPETQAAQSLIPLSQLAPDPNCGPEAGGSSMPGER